jgi:hypothetical protein
MHSSHSDKKMNTFSKEAMIKDTVWTLIYKRVGVKLGKVTLQEIDNAMHDIFLSPKAVRGCF